MPDNLSPFVASASHPALGGELAPGRLTFDRWRLKFACPSLTFEIPLDRVEIEIVSEEENTTVYFRDPQNPEWLVQTPDAQVLNESALRHQSHTRNQIKAIQSQGELKRRLVVTLWFVVGFAVLAWAVTLLTGVMARALVARIPLQWEQQVGDSVIAEIKQFEPMVQDPKLFAKLDLAVAPLIKALPPSSVQYKFYIVDEPLPNAFALPGGHVLVTTGLLDLAERPEHLAGVVAHEIAHVTQRHGFRKILSAAGPYLVCRLFVGERGGLLGMLGQSSELLVRQSFSQEYELEADSVGWDYMIAARIDPRGMTEILRKLQLEQNALRRSDPEIRAFSSHPATEKRVRKLEEKWNKLKDKSAFDPLPGP